MSNQQSEHPEFVINTHEGLEPHFDLKRTHWEELWLMRSVCSSHARREWELRGRQQQRANHDQKRYGDLLRKTVHLADGIRHLVHTELLSQSASEEAPNILEKLFGSHKSSSSEEETECQELWKESLRELEEQSIHYIELLHQTISSVSFQENGIEEWVSILNAETARTMIVQEVVRGLWVRKEETEVILLQRAEVLLE